MQKLTETQLSRQAQIQSLMKANERLTTIMRELIETLTPFAETGKAVETYRDDQMTMAGAQIPAKHFKKARSVLTKVAIDVKKYNL